MAQPWYMYGFSGAPYGSKESGRDLGVPFRTPVTAILPGTVNWAGRTKWACGSSGGEVCIVTNVPGQSGLFTSYYLHLDSATVSVGDKVNAGQLIGYSGGQLSGGNWPVQNCPNITYSTGPHLEFGFNANWVSGPGHSIDPTNIINMARLGQLAGTGPQGNSPGTPGGTPSPVPTPTPTPTPGGTAGNAIASLADPLPVDQSIENIVNLSIATHKVITRLEGWESICEDVQQSFSYPKWNPLNPVGSIFSRFQPFMYRLVFVVIGLAILLYVLREEIKGMRTAVTNINMPMLRGGGGGSSGGASGAGAAALEAAPEAVAL